MGKQSISKKYSVLANGILDIDGSAMSISVEDVGEFRLDELLRDFNGYQVKITVTYDENQGAPEDQSVC